ncbi:hypothetical protein ACHAW6_000838, partial [Cyclotella cf. meneghiniana]
MALPHDPVMIHRDQAAGSRRHQIPTLCLCRACLMPEHRMAVHLPNGSICRFKPITGGERPLHEVPACSSWHR